MTASAGSPPPDALDPAAPSPPGRVFALFLRVLLGVVPGFVVGDLLAGYVTPTQDLREEGAVVVDEELGWTNQPGEVVGDGRISSIGLRGPELPDDPPEDELRVLGLGASRVFGIGVDRHEDLWNAVLEERLNRGDGPPWRVMNAGVKAYSLLQSSRLGERLLSIADPDLVLLFADPGAQSMIDASSASEWTRVGEATMPRDIVDATPPWLHPFIVPLHKTLLHSNLYTRYRAQFLSSGGRAESLKRFVLHRGAWPEGAEPHVLAAIGGTVSLAGACAARGVELRVVVLPYPTAVNGWSWRRYLQLNQAEGAPPVDSPRRDGVEILLGEFARRGITTWDLTPELEEIGRDLERNTTDERHWSAAGHRIVADGLAARVRGDGALVSRLVEARRARPRR